MLARWISWTMTTILETLCHLSLSMSPMMTRLAKVSNESPSLRMTPSSTLKDSQTTKSSICHIPDRSLTMTKWSNLLVATSFLSRMRPMRNLTNCTSWPFRMKLYQIIWKLTILTRLIKIRYQIIEANRRLILMRQNSLSFANCQNLTALSQLGSTNKKARIGNLRLWAIRTNPYLSRRQPKTWLDSFLSKKLKEIVQAFLEERPIKPCFRL